MPPDAVAARRRTRAWPMLLACLLHAKGRGRKSKDMEDVQRIMKDHNLDNKGNK